jgi:hypothetical protein
VVSSICGPWTGGTTSARLAIALSRPIALILLSVLPLAGCLAERTFVRCTTCKAEPYVATSQLSFDTQWGARCMNVQTQPIDCEHSDYDISVRCMAPCATGMCEIECSTRTGQGKVSVAPRRTHDDLYYTGPVRVDITLHKHDTDLTYDYQSPVVWFSNEGVVLLCVDRRPGAAHPLMPCKLTGVPAADPVFAIAWEDDHSHLFTTEPRWFLMDRAVINEQLVAASETIKIGELRVPLFSLADRFAPFRTAGGGLKPAHYRVSVARPPEERLKAEQTIELEVK